MNATQTNNPYFALNDWERLDVENVATCARQRRCARCGARLGFGHVALIGTEKSVEVNVYDLPWLHDDCAEAMALQSPVFNGLDPAMVAKHGRFVLVRARAASVKCLGPRWVFIARDVTSARPVVGYEAAGVLPS